MAKKKTTKKTVKKTSRLVSKKSASRKRKVQRKATGKEVEKPLKQESDKSMVQVPTVKQQNRKKGYSKEELEHFKNIILEKRKEILDELESLKSSMMDVTTGQYEVENSTYSLHMEQGTDAMEREKTFLFASRESKFLNYLNDALKRIEDGTYGFCSECGNLIDKERLEAVPHAHLCIACKTKKSGR